jgi:hypothetical protein
MEDELSPTNLEHIIVFEQNLSLHGLFTHICLHVYTNYNRWDKSLADILRGARAALTEASASFLTTAAACVIPSTQIVYLLAGRGGPVTS